MITLSADMKRVVDEQRRIRVIVVIRVDHARPLISPGYDTEKSESSMQERWMRYYTGEVTTPD